MSRVACIGAGNVGRAWAVVFARAGHEVALYDADPGVVTGQALPLAARTIRDLHDAGLIADDPASVERRIRPAASIAEAVAGVAFLQESVREDLAVKQAVFEEVGQLAPPGAILASSTSAISGSSFLGGLPGPERCLVAHPVNPPSVIPLVELCGTRWTTPKTLEDARAFMAAAGMKPVTLLREIDGFLLNRLQFCLVAEALHLVGEGYCTPEDIDTVMTEGLARRWAFIGPFEVAHLNATQGFQGFFDNLGAMARRLGADARTDYAWSPELITAIHARLAARTPVTAITDRQQWRDRTIMRRRALDQ